MLVTGSRVDDPCLPGCHVFCHEGAAIIRRVWRTTSGTGKTKIADLRRDAEDENPVLRFRGVIIFPSGGDTRLL